MPTSTKLSINKLSQRGAIQFIIPLILLLGIVGVVYLVTKGPLKIFPKAANTGTRIEFAGSTVTGDKTTSRNVKVKAYYLQPSPSPTLTPSPVLSPSPTPTETSPTPTSRRVFVTSTQYNAILGGLPGADDKCQARAKATTLGGVWKAWLSDSNTSVASRLEHFNGPYKLLNGSMIAQSWNELVRLPPLNPAGENLLGPININELGNQVSPRAVWSNTSANGSIADTNPVTGSCRNWQTLAEGSGRVGNTAKSNFQWTNDTITGECKEFELASLYCFEQSSSLIVSPSPSPTTPTQSPSPVTRIPITRSGNAAVFTAGSSVKIPDSHTVGKFRRVTMEAWVKPYTAGGPIISKRFLGGAANDSFAYQLELTAQGKLKFMYSILYQNRWAPVEITSNSSINLNTWTHVAVLYNTTPGSETENTIALYIDGRRDKEQQQSGEIGGGSETRYGDDVLIGTDVGFISSFNGEIDEVFITGDAGSVSCKFNESSGNPNCLKDGQSVEARAVNVSYVSSTGQSSVQGVSEAYAQSSDRIGIVTPQSNSSRGFGSTQGSVLYSATYLQIESWSDREIRVKIPANLTILNPVVVVLINSNLNDSVNGNLTVLPQPTFPTHFRLANDVNGLSSAQELEFKGNPTEVDWVLAPGNGLRTVYAEFKVDGVWGSRVSASISLVESTTPGPVTPTTSFTLSFSKQQYNVGEEVAVNILVHSDITAANLFDAKINYDPQVLQLNRVDNTSSFIKNWVEQDSQDPGKISLVGGVPNPGFQSQLSDSPLMATLHFTALKIGSTTISFDDTSAIYSNADNTNILTTKDSVTLSISSGATPAPYVCSACDADINQDEVVTILDFSSLATCFNKEATTSVGTQSCSRADINRDGRVTLPDFNCLADKFNKSCSQGVETGPAGGMDQATRRSLRVQLESIAVEQVPAGIGSTAPVATPVPGTGDGNGDGKINLVDLSVLLSDFNKTTGFRRGIDLNGDGKINTFDFSLMRNLLIQKGVIRG